MTHSNPNLLPTVVTDKNGKITTVHKKNNSHASSLAASIPAPVLGHRRVQKATTVSRFRTIAHVAAEGTISASVIKGKTERFLKNSTPEQLERLDEALAGLESVTTHERLILSSAFTPLAQRQGDTGAIHEIIAHRKAFASEWAVRNEPRSFMYHLESFIYGARDNGKGSKYELECSDESVVNPNIASIRFAYELKERAPYGGFLPTRNGQVITGDDPKGGYTFGEAFFFDRRELKSLVEEYAHRVDDLIEFSITQQTSDPHRLRALLEHEGHSSLTYGLL